MAMGLRTPHAIAKPEGARQSRCASQTTDSIVSDVHVSERGETTFVVVSDHGMTAVRGVWICVDDYIDLASVEFMGGGAFLQLRPKPDALESVYWRPKGANRHLTVARRLLVH
jgi:Type I phosphodiesterase / nucleotide pyrophosphatase